MSPRLTRRRAVRDAGLAAGGLVLAVGAGGCGDGRAAPDALTRVALAELTEGTRIRIDHHGEPVELVRRGAEVTARSLICTHERCTLFWHAPGNAYRCPCHGATFDPAGRPATGPVSVPMWTLPTRVIGNEVIVGGAGAA